ncbi:copper-binding protein [Paraburkholderia sp.]|uniref:copper-binding protein n=1 Tax=Paraburkholderia sp. TaxID=1926495 RepID=UPI0025DA8424|nr:copper-binding protein [Paraburkholderia sp.]
MKRTIVAVATLSAAFAATLAATAAAPAFAADAMAGMNMSAKPSAMHPAMNNALASAEVRKVNAANGMITLKHGALENIGMPPMIMAYKAKDADMVKQVHEGDKVKVRIENIGGTPVIVKLEKQS